ncbi:set1/Ash2 histone methyltransferase complex subunit ASH2-like [Artemia franciscana]|uniref:set1/Ash2 histone methyltransferase complex subunit ASH2-like n=1 Tax=Artemia franciscana TaxID=6661 RepID=UPI0032DAB662
MDKIDEDLPSQPKAKSEDVKEEGNCYCGKERNLNSVELLCASCFKWYHELCIGQQLGKLVPFMLSYVFLCKNCSPSGLEVFKKSQAQFSHLCITAIANLLQISTKEGKPRQYFSKEREIIPFVDAHWESMTAMPRRATSSWHATIHKTLSKERGSTFTYQETSEPLNAGFDCYYYGLVYSDVQNIRPPYEALIRSGHLKISEFGLSGGGNQTSARRGQKRKADQGAGRRTRSELNVPKLPAHGYPMEHPFNKDGYRYILAEPDPHAPFRQEFDESNDWAGKPIPGWLYRTLCPTYVLLALHDRAPQLKISEDRLAVTGDKGYCMVRATHSVSKGSWYWECTIGEMPDNSATRIGWAQCFANLQTPLGFDKFGYSWRSRKGTKFHEAKGYHFSDGYCEGDVLGMMIILPDSHNCEKYRPPTHKDKPLVKFKSYLYYEEKDGTAEALKLVKPMAKSKILFFKNGVCQGEAFTDINDGTYYPCISVFKSATVSVNFGPNFKYPPEGYDYNPVSNRADEGIVEQAVADMLYLVENEGKLRLDVF